MRVAVLGVGLIGGSIGLAARERLEAEVSGWDLDPDLLARASERGAIDSAAPSVADAVREAEIVFCAAPVGPLPGLAAEALAAAGDDAAVTDVGSVKREVIARLGDDPRFIGGHPLAGAETSGVDNARADLFEGARWYLTPTPKTGGVLYDRVQRAIAEMGARPQAIDAAAHDRLMATISHLPHVLANVLVDRATELSSGERLPAVGPSFRDATRVAGANPEVWTDIFVGNREAVASEVEAVSAALAEVANTIRGGEAGAVAEWQELIAARRARLLEEHLPGGPLRELRVRVENRPGVVAEIALALGDAGVNIHDMGLYPAADMRTGAVSVFVAGSEEAERGAAKLRDLGHDVTIASR